MKKLNKKWLVRGGIIVALAVIAYYAWTMIQPDELGEGFVSGNGRIEAVEIDVAAKTPGRLADILVNDGDYVKKGQVVAHMDTQVLEAQLAEAQAQLSQARTAVNIARNQVTQRRSESAAAAALAGQRAAELNAASRRLARSRTLAAEGATSVQEYDDDRARQEGSRATLSAAKAQVAAANATISTSRSQVLSAQSNVVAMQAMIKRIKADIEDSALKAPRSGRVQYRIAQPGEVLAGGGKVINLVDLTDVYMTFFLPETVVGRVALNQPVHIVLDAIPDFVIPARVSFVADVAQFTPKTVETASERQKLMFRVKARIDPKLLKQNVSMVKTGLPGVAYMKIDPKAVWPERLKINVSDGQ